MCFLQKNQAKQGFTLIELGVMIAIVIMVFALFLRPTKGENTKAQMIRCQSNLKQISLSLQIFANDHNGHYPWQEFPSLNSDSSLRESSPPPLESWQYFLTLGNVLDSPRSLICPADVSRYYTRVPANFTGPTNSLEAPDHRNLSISYFIGLNGDRKTPQAIMLGDRHISREGGPEFRESPLSTVMDVDVRTAQWWSTPRQPFHPEGGNLAFSDGSIHQTTTDQLRETLRVARKNYGTNANRFLFPQ